MNQPSSTPAVDKDPAAYDLAQRIADHLTGSWTPHRRRMPDGEELPKHAEIVRDADGATITVHVGGYRQDGRVMFGTGWPTYSDGQRFAPRTYPSITCSAGRDGKALAKEIERRLLVDYDPAYRTALEQVRATDAADAQAWRVAERIARATGAELPREGGHRQRRAGAAVELRGPGSVRGLKVYPPYRDRSLTTSFEIHDVDEETTLEILELVNRKAHSGQ
jgi:hypothetical protein